MIELKYQNFETMPINVFLRLKKILADENLKDQDKEFEIIALLADMSIEDLMELNLSDLQGIRNKCLFLQTQNIEIKKDINEVNINGITYKVCKNLQNFTVALYVDFQNYPKDEQHIAENLSTFVIPKGKKYGEGYDVVLQINDFKNYMDISTAISLQNFFLQKLVKYTKNTLRFLVPLLKKKMKTSKNEKAKEQLLKITELEQKFGYLLLI